MNKEDGKLTKEEMQEFKELSERLDRALCAFQTLYRAKEEHTEKCITLCTRDSGNICLPAIDVYTMIGQQLREYVMEITELCQSIMGVHK